MINRVIIMDTSIASENGGDHIIMDYCNKQLHENIGGTFFCHVPTHDYLSSESYKKINNSRFGIVCGTNLLSSNMNKYNQWKIDLRDLKYLKNNVVLMGVGWWQYQETPNKYTRYLLRHVLSKTQLHSVRDQYTEKMLKDIGIKNVVYTGCPTMWSLRPELTEQISKTKKKNVVFTVTNYSPRVEDDILLYNILEQEYEHIAIWLQSFEDYDYICRLGIQNQVELIGPTLDEFDRYLDTHDVDYVGTRLHAGVRALNHKKRAIIIGIDNRAIEISRDTGLTVIDRKDVAADLRGKINSDFSSRVDMPRENIQLWLEDLNKNLK